MENNNYKVGEKYNIFCVDCDKCTDQIYRGMTRYRGYFFICDECGCENYEDKEDVNT